MFYNKINIRGIEIKFPLDPEVFTYCTECGKKMEFDLIELAESKDFDLLGTSIMCGECSEKQMRKRYGGK